MKSYGTWTFRPNVLNVGQSLVKLLDWLNINFTAYYFFLLQGTSFTGPWTLLFKVQISLQEYTIN